MQRISLENIKPTKIVAVGLNYMDHIKEFGDRDVPKTPTLFIKLPHTIIGPEDTIFLPKESNRVDYEAEMAVVIKKFCSRVKKEDAKDYILGVTCLNDVTARDIQRGDGQWTRGKNFETFCPIGPHIVTDLAYNNLDIELKLNGEIKQSSNTKNLIWNVEELIEFISNVIPLRPGDMITTGTPSGVEPLKDGDIVEITLEGVGTLKNYVKDSQNLRQ
ncbi:MAG: fumarylacetoacetate hydrolase family protein [Clostridiales bacterium]|nr:fumarylacetoacetate hydrolase family protein [Clostridiales bacterium]